MKEINSNVQSEDLGREKFFKDSVSSQPEKFKEELLIFNSQDSDMASNDQDFENQRERTSNFTKVTPKGSKQVKKYKHANPSSNSTRFINPELENEKEQILKKGKNFIKSESNAKKEKHICKIKVEVDQEESQINNNQGVNDEEIDQNQKKESYFKQSNLRELNSENEEAEILLKQQKSQTYSDKKLEQLVKQKSKNLQFNKELQMELMNIEIKEKYRVIVDQFLNKFNSQGQIGINFAIENEICENSPSQIAQFLLTTKGIDKRKLGAFFSTDSSLNQEVLLHFCKQLNYERKSLSEAIRLSLSKFRLPGEAQQIDRIISIISKEYFLQNPTAFNNEDIIYILIYSAIMLNVDQHSQAIQKSDKMKKSTFVKNNLLCTKNAVTEQYLEDLFDNIREKPFETNVDDVEKVYIRLSPIKSKIFEFTDSQIRSIQEQLSVPKNYIKYGRIGQPKVRTIRLNPDINSIKWTDISENPSKERSIKISDIIDFSEGCSSTEVMKNYKIPPEFDYLCFSIITNERTLDLKCPNSEIKWNWISFLYNYLSQKRRKENNLIKNAFKDIDSNKIDSIWHLSIFSEWEYHWDISTSKPKGFIQKDISLSKLKGVKRKCRQFNDKTKKSIEQLKECFYCFNHNNSKNYIRKVLKSIDAPLEKYSNIMIPLWQLGLPSWVRLTIWPLSIKNQLEISENLFEILNNQSDVLLRQHDQVIDLMISDLNRLKETSNLHKQSTIYEQSMVEKVLKKFISYRPDIGYFNESMANIVSVIAQTIPDEASIFRCFINMVHQNYFHALYRGQMEEIKWRVQYFDLHLFKRIPIVKQHFDALDLSSEIFLIPWLLNLFSNVFDLQSVQWIFDNFILEGEVFAFKLGIAFIEYFSFKLQISTFDEAVQLLKGQFNQEFFPRGLFSRIQSLDEQMSDFGGYRDFFMIQTIKKQFSPAQVALNQNNQ